MQALRHGLHGHLSHAIYVAHAAFWSIYGVQHPTGWTFQKVCASETVLLNLGFLELDCTKVQKTLAVQAALVKASAFALLIDYLLQ